MQNFKKILQNVSALLQSCWARSQCSLEWPWVANDYRYSIYIQVLNLWF